MAEVIEVREISDIAGDRFGSFAKYIIQSRAIPDVRDGLKPVQRRILYAMDREGYTSDKPYRKSAKTVGIVIGNYHPHGDSSVYEAMVRLSQDWKMGTKLIEMHGNNGSMDGDSAAAMRYTESRLAKIVTTGLTASLDKKGLVEFTNNFDDSLQEPVVLPAQYPNLLVNGVSGISTGYATAVAPHNFKESLEALKMLLMKPDATLDEILEVMPAPDFPTGGIIVGAKGIRNVYATGKGAITMRAKYHIESDKKRQYIVFTEIPYEVNKKVLVSKLTEVALDKKVVGIIDARDETDREGLRIVVECSKDANIQVILGYLFSKTPLQSNYNLNMVAIVNKKPKLLGLRELLVEFNRFRVQTKVKELNYDKAKCEARLHIVKGFIRLSDILDEVIKIIRQADGKAGAKAGIMEAFGFSEIQAEEIVKLQLYRLSRSDKEKYLEEEMHLSRLIKAITETLESKAKLRNMLIRGYDKLIKEFGEDRKTEVVMEAENWDVAKTDIIKEEDVVVGISKGGYIKRSSTRSFNSTDVGGLVEGDEEIFSGQGTTKNVLMVFTNKANYMYIPIHEIEDMKWKDTGKHIANYGANLAEDEYILEAFIITDEDKERNIVIAKTNGQVKRTKVADHEVMKRYFNLYTAIKFKGSEEVAKVWLTGDEGFIGFKDAKGRSMYFKVDEIPINGLKTGGVRGIHLDSEDESVAEVVFVLTEEEMPVGYEYRERGKKGYAVRKGS